MNKYGGFINPNPTKMSDFQNDYNYMIIKEYKLNESNLSKSPSITIDDIKAGSTIVEISLKVNSAFTSNKNAAIEIVTDSGETLFSKNINDMNMVEAILEILMILQKYGLLFAMEMVNTLE